MRTQFLEETLGGYLAHLRGQIDGRVRIALEDGPLSDETVRSIVAETLKLARSELAAREDLEWSSREFAEAAVAPGAEPYDKVVSAVFENLPLEDESKVGQHSTSRNVAASSPQSALLTQSSPL